MNNCVVCDNQKDNSFKVCEKCENPVCTSCCWDKECVIVCGNCEPSKVIIPTEKKGKLFFSFYCGSGTKCFLHTTEGKCGKECRESKLSKWERDKIKYEEQKIEMINNEKEKFEEKKKESSGKCCYGTDILWDWGRFETNMSCNQHTDTDEGTALCENHQGMCRRCWKTTRIHCFGEMICYDCNYKYH